MTKFIDQIMACFERVQNEAVVEVSAVDEDKLFAGSLILRKTSNGKHFETMMMVFTRAKTENAALRIFLLLAERDRPGFSAVNFTVLLVPDQ